MKHTKTRIISIVSMWAIMVISLCVVFVPEMTQVKAVESEMLAVGIEYTIPDMEIGAPGAKVEATDKRLIFPDGKMYKNTANTFNLDMEGEYTVVYSVVVDGTTISEEKVFKVVDKAYALNGSGSRLEYGKAPILSKIKGQDVNCLNVDLKPGAVFKYNKKVTLPSIPADANLKENGGEYSLITMGLYDVIEQESPDKEYNYAFDIDAYETIVRITDENDPDNFIEVNLAPISDNGKSGHGRDLIKAKAGYRYNMKCGRRAEWDGSKMLDRWFAGSSGTGAGATCIGDGTGEARTYSIIYDKDTKSIGLRNERVNYAENSGTNTIYMEILDFDADNIVFSDYVRPRFDDMPKFTGFSSDNVYISVYASGYVVDKDHYIEDSQGQTALKQNKHLEITELRGADLAENGFSDIYSDRHCDKPVIMFANDVTLDSEYKLGTKLTRPAVDGIYVNKKVYPSNDVRVMTPNGELYKLDEYSLDTVGTYTLKAYAEVDGKHLSAEYSFVVDNRQVKTEIKTDESLKYTHNSGAGIYLKDGDVLRYNKPITLNYTDGEFGLKNTYEKHELISIMPYFTYFGKYKKKENGQWVEAEGDIYAFDATYEIRLIDENDPENYIEIEITAKNTNTNAYQGANYCAFFRAGYRDQVKCGYKCMDPDHIQKVHQNGDWGAEGGWEDHDQPIFELLFDKDGNTLYLRRRYAYCNSSRSIFPVLDFDDPSVTTYKKEGSKKVVNETIPLFDGSEGRKPFPGFEGNINVEISAKDTVGERSYFEILKLGQYEGLQLDDFHLVENKTESNEESYFDTQYVTGEILYPENVFVKHSFSKGEQLTIPDVQLTADGVVYDVAEKYLKYPSGKTIGQDTYTLNEIGRYSILYYAADGEKVISCTHDFIVKDDLFSVSSDKSKAEASNDLKISHQNGINVDLSEGDVFRFNEPVALKSFSNFNELENDNSELFTIYPFDTVQEDVNGEIETYYDVEAKVIVIRLTDSVDKDNYIEIEVAMCQTNSNLPKASRCIFVRAGWHDQQKTGFEEYKGTSPTIKKINCHDIIYRIHYDTWGSLQDWASSKQKMFYKIIYDNNSQEVGIVNAYGKYKTVTLLASSDVYGNNIDHKFKSDEVFVSAYAKDYIKKSVDFEFTKIGSHIGDGFLQKDTVDEDAPAIGGIERELLDNGAKIALGEEILLKDFVALDASSCITNVEVLYENQYKVFVKDNRFTPSRMGSYTINYMARDVFGNVKVVHVALECVDVPHTTTIDQEFSTEFISGQFNKIPECQAHSINGCGFVNIRVVSVDHPEEIIELNENHEIFAKYVGDYKIVYEYGDIVSNYTFEKVVHCKASDNLYVEPLTVNFPEYLIKGASYTLPEVVAYRYNEANPAKIDVKYFVQEDGGELVEIDLEKYTVTAQNTVKFVIKYNDRIIFEGQDIKVIDTGFEAGKVYMEKYFVGNVTTVATQNGIVINPATAADSEFAFINALSRNTFTLSFKGEAEKLNFRIFAVTFVDYYNRDNRITVNFEVKDEELYFYVNNNTPAFLQKSIADPVLIDSISNGTITFRNGTKFDFPSEMSSDKMLCHFELKGVTGDAGIIISNLGNQKLGNRQTDSVEAAIFADNSAFGLQEIGKTISVKKFEATDVLTPYLAENATIKVVDEDGNFITSLEGVVLDGVNSKNNNYSFKLDKYTKYQIFYQYKDQFDNEYYSLVMVVVEDRQAPEITLEEGYAENMLYSAQLGDGNTIVGIAKYTAKDNIGEPVVRIGVMRPDGGYEDIHPEDMSFVANIKGIYKVCYYAYDEVGNYSMRYYFVEVK